MTDPVEIVQQAIWAAWCQDGPQTQTSGPDARCRNAAHAVLAALERSGYRIVSPYPTDDMLQAIQDLVFLPSDFQSIEEASKSILAAEFNTAISAAPTYGGERGKADKVLEFTALRSCKAGG